MADLFDSIRREYPIGSFFLWIVPQELRLFFKTIPDLQLPEPAPFEQMKLILDGQQRLTSLYVSALGLVISENGKSKKDYKKICFDLDTDKFLVGNAEDKIKTVSVWRFFDDKAFNEVYETLTPTRRKSFLACKQLLSGYPVSIVYYKGDSLEDAVLIFTRINQSGKKLSLFDLVVAQTWSKDFDLKEAAKHLNGRLKKKGFGELQREVFSQAIGLAVKNSCTTESQLGLKNGEVKETWKPIAEAVELAVDFLRGNLGVRVADFLPYPSMVALLAAFYVKRAKPSLTAQQASFLKEWFWKAAFSQRYAKALATTMGEDWNKYFEPLARGESPKLEYKVNISERDLSDLKIYTRSAIKSAVLCLLALKGPRHFANNTVLILDESLCSHYNDRQKHHIFPNAFLKRINVGKNRHLLANFTFLPKEINQAISDKPPSEYFEEYRKSNRRFSETLDSHLIPIGPESGIWDDNYDKFIAQRISLLMLEIARATGQITAEQQQLEGHPNTAIDEIETELRDYLDRTLEAVAAGNYWPLIPPDIHESVRKKIDEYRKRHPYISDGGITNRARLDYMDLGDYCKIILKNWELFEPAFGSKAEVEAHFRNLKEYRNALKHGRQADTVIRKQGEASAEWLLRILKKAEKRAAAEMS